VTDAASEEASRRIVIGLNLFPNIISVDLNLKKKLYKNNALHICFVSKDSLASSQQSQRIFTNKVKTIRKAAVQSYAFVLDDFIHKVETDELPINAVFITERLSAIELSMLRALTAQQHALLFSPFDGDVARGVTAGVFIGSKILPYLNMQSVRESDIEFHPLFLKLARKYE